MQTPHTTQAYLLGCLMEELLHLRHVGPPHGNGDPGGLDGETPLEGKHHPWSGRLLLPFLLITHPSSASDEETTLFYLIWTLSPPSARPLWYSHRPQSSFRGSLCSNRAVLRPQLPPPQLSFFPRLLRGAGLRKWVRVWEPAAQPLRTKVSILPPSCEPLCPGPGQHPSPELVAGGE